MVQKNGEFSKSDLTKMLNRPEAQAMLARLKQMDACALQQAVQLVFQGHTDRARDVLTPLMQDEELQNLASQMRDSDGGI